MTSPLTNSVDDKIAAAFPSSKPLEDKADLVQCKQCRKPILRHVAKEHIKDCQRKKQEKIQKKKEAKEAKELLARREKGLDEDDERPKGARKSAVTGADDGDDDDSAAKKTKKRKAEEGLEKGSNAKKKKKDDGKPKAGPKAKGPVDVEKQCGVPLPNGLLCARSLTCKSHAMGAKRAVPGRSLPYDMLLAQYQKKNQAKQQSESRVFCPDRSMLTSSRSRNRRQRTFGRRLRQSRPGGFRRGARCRDGCRTARKASPPLHKDLHFHAVKVSLRKAQGDAPKRTQRVTGRKALRDLGLTKRRGWAWTIRCRCGGHLEIGEHGRFRRGA